MLFSAALRALHRRRLLRQLSSPRPSKLGIQSLESRCLLSANPLLPDALLPDALLPEALPAGPAAPAAAVSSVPGELLVEFKASASDKQIRGLYQAHGMQELEQLYRAERVHRVAVPEAAAEAVTRALARNPLVEYVEPNHVASALFTPNDPFYRHQWHLTNSSYGGVHADQAWDTTRGAGAVVAVLDTGVAYENYSDATGQYYVAPDLAGTQFVPGYDFINGDAHPNDDHSHGTHVAGTIAQNSNNGLGASGVAFESSIMPVKVLGKDGLGSYSAIANGIRWAADHGADVINMSLGSSSPSTTLADALAYAHGKGVTIVAAAGNDGQGTVSYPAAYNAYVIAVSATRFDERLAGYSNYGSSIDLAAPGGDVSVDQNGDGYVDGVLQNTINPNTKDPSDFGYYFFQGTSMAAPHVAGVAALVVSQGVTDPDQVRQILQSSAEDKGTAGVDNYYGHGIVNAAAALASISSGNTAPVASNDTASTRENTAVVINVLGNDRDPDGDLLKVSGVGQPSNGSVAINSNNTISYTPATNYHGTDAFTYTASDGNGGSATATVTVTVEETAASGSSAINFANYAIGSYGMEDQGSATVQDGGATLHLAGNSWKQIAFPYQVTPDTILEFDFRSPVQGEIHSIGFDSNLKLSSPYGFTVYGTQSWGRSNYDDYAASAPEWKHYQIPVGQFYTGSFKHLFFGNDNDASSSNGEGYFANVKVYEAGASNSPPTAQDDQFIVSSDSSGNLLNVLANDSTSPDSGETLTVTAVSAGSAGGAVSIASDSRLRYTPRSGFTGQETFTYTASDGNGGSATAKVTVTVETTPSGLSTINFADYAIGSYGTEDQGSATAQDGGATLHLEGNSWKQIALPYQVTADTILEFDFRSPTEGEIHTIGFDSDLGLSKYYAFTLYGTQTWGRSNYDDYAPSAPEWKHYQIPVGQFYTGSFQYLFFGNDNDDSSSNGEGYFANVKVYEARLSAASPFTGNDAYSTQESRKSTFLTAPVADADLSALHGPTPLASAASPMFGVPHTGGFEAVTSMSLPAIRAISGSNKGTPQGAIATAQNESTTESGRALERGEWSLRVDEVFSGEFLNSLGTL